MAQNGSYVANEAALVLLECGWFMDDPNQQNKRSAVFDYALKIGVGSFFLGFFLLIAGTMVSWAFNWSQSIRIAFAVFIFSIFLVFLLSALILWVECIILLAWKWRSRGIETNLRLLFFLVVCPVGAAFIVPLFMKDQLNKREGGVTS